ncbi:MAG: SDR family oxidoreductase [Proteobacteria bacterium]|nr:SDR family oxidoreductase [Pseudomonadota bacterium]
MTDKLLTGKRALVTGASSGLGARFAEILAADGAEVLLAARRVDRLTSLVASITAGGGKASPLELDVTDPGSVSASVAAAFGDGGVDILVNNAGISIEKRITDFTLDDYDRLMGTNQRGAWLVAQAVGQGMIARGQGGKIVNIASVLASSVLTGLSLYSMSKAAIVQMTRSMALEWARFDIQVNALAPGYIETEINTGHFNSEAGKKQIEKLLRKRVGHPRDLDGALRLLVASDSNFITGSVITLDDGQTLKGF